MLFRSTIFQVEVDSLPGPAGVITGTPVVCAGTDNITFSVSPVSNTVTYVWTLPPGATIISGGGTNSIVVSLAENAISGNITVYGNNLCGNGPPSPSWFVTVNPVPVTPLITLTGDTLISSAPFGNQWFYNGIVLVNDTSQTHVVSPGLPGYYWTQVTLNGCVSDTSKHVYYIPPGFSNDAESVLSIFPNPVITRLFIECPGSLLSFNTVEIFRMGGERIYEKQIVGGRIIVNVENYQAGVYLVKVKTKGFIWVRKFVKD